MELTASSHRAATDWSGSYCVSAPVNVVFGVGTLHDAVDRALDAMEAKRVLLITSSSVRSSRQFQEVEAAIGARCGGVFSGTRSHLPRAVVIEATAACESIHADGIVTLGGGSSMDAGKAVRAAFAVGIRRTDDFDHIDDDVMRASLASAVPHIALPTTLSGAEFTEAVGVTDEPRRHKQVISAPGLGYRTIVLDPMLTMGTPPTLWVHGAIKVLSDAIEIMTMPELNPALAPLAERAASLLADRLRDGTMNDVNGRMQLQLASWMTATTVVQSRTRMGLAAVLRHILGPTLNASHAAIAATLLPHVHRFNSKAISGERHEMIARAIGLPADASQDEVVERLRAVATVAPTGLRDFGMSRDMIGTLADSICTDVSSTTNPRHDITPDEVAALLHDAY